MPDILVAISTVADGSMYNRHDPLDEQVIRNRERFLSQRGISVDATTRVKTVYPSEDYCKFSEVTLQDGGAGMRDDAVINADGLVTRERGHALMVPVADCVGTVLFDPDNHVLMVSHLGRHSLEQDGGSKSVEYLVKNYGTDPTKVKVWLTPAPGKDVYPIWVLDNKGMKEVTFEQLAAAGIMRENITDNPADSARDRTYYSHSEYLKGNREEDGDHMLVAMMPR